MNRSRKRDASPLIFHPDRPLWSALGRCDNLREKTVTAEEIDEAVKGYYGDEDEVNGTFGDDYATPQHAADVAGNIGLIVSIARWSTGVYRG